MRLRLGRCARRAPLALTLILVASCGHDAALAPGTYAPGRPAGTGPAVRLTFNPGVDQGPAWLPGGTGILYTNERIDRDDLDRCLAVLPAVGGSIQREICDLVPAADDSVDAFTWSAVSGSGRLAYVRATASLALGSPTSPDAQQLVVALWSQPDGARVLTAIPYTAPSGRVHLGVAQVHWLGDTSLVYVGQRVVYSRPCLGCPVDTLATGIEIVRLDLGGATPRLTTLPGTDAASSVTTVGSDTVYFTLNGDSRAYRLTLSTDSVAVVHDFGAGGIARDVQVAAGRLVAVIGGNVSYVNDPLLGLVQRDSGGTLVLVGLATGTETALTPPDTLYRHPALAPDGRHVVAEAVLGRTTDLYLLEVP